MFDGMPEQFYQFLAAASRANTTTCTTTCSPLALPLSFSLHHHHHHHHPNNSNYSTTSFDDHLHHQQQQQGLLSPPPPPHLLLHQHNPPQLPLHLQTPSSHKHHHKQEPVVGVDHVVRSELEPIDDHHPWSNDEVLALLRIRSSMDNTWFPDFTTWDNVSRKLAEVGFKRSAEKCKEKFEEETRNFNSSFITNTSTTNNCNNKNNNSNNVSNITNNNNYRLFGELEEVYTDHNQQSPPLSPAPEPEPEPEPEHVVVVLSQRNQTPAESRQKNEHEEQVQDLQEDKRNDKEEEEVMVREEDSKKTEENRKRLFMRKRKRRQNSSKFEMFKGFCESIVNKMMAQQEQLHSKILQDMVKRDEEKIAKEESWKKQEIERIHKEMDARAHEQAIACHRQAQILEFLKKFMSSSSSEIQSLGEAIENLIKVPTSLSTSSCTTSQQHDHHHHHHLQNPSSSSLMVINQKCSNLPSSISSPNNENLAPQSPNRVDNSKLVVPVSSPSTDQPSQNPNPLSNSTAENDTLFKLASVSSHSDKPSRSDIHTSTDAAEPINMEFRATDSSTQANHRAGVGNSTSGGGGKDNDTGRRWPRDEVLALINIRCNLFNNNGDPQHDKEGSTKGPLWERISQKMMELGYKRSAKRCKEKWENINKYFRKTKDLNKKRSIDSRTCPYFYQLSHLYDQGKLLSGSTHQPTTSENMSNNITALSSIQGGGSSTSNHGTTPMDDIASQGNEGVVQAPSFDFEF